MIKIKYKNLILFALLSLLFSSLPALSAGGLTPQQIQTVGRYNAGVINTANINSINYRNFEKSLWDWQIKREQDKDSLVKISPDLNPEIPEPKIYIEEVHGKIIK